MITLRDAIRPHAVAASSTALLADEPVPSLVRELELLDGVSVTPVAADDVAALDAGSLLVVATARLDVATLAAQLRQGPDRLCLVVGFDVTGDADWPSLLTLAGLLDAQIVSISPVQGALPCVVTLVKSSPLQAPLAYLDDRSEPAEADDVRALSIRLANELVVTTVMNRVLASRVAHPATASPVASTAADAALRAAQAETARLAQRLNAVESSPTYRTVRVIGRVRRTVTRRARS